MKIALFTIITEIENSCSRNDDPVLVSGGPDLFERLSPAEIVNTDQQSRATAHGAQIEEAYSRNKDSSKISDHYSLESNKQIFDGDNVSQSSTRRNTGKRGCKVSSNHSLLTTKQQEFLNER